MIFFLFYFLSIKLVVGELPPVACSPDLPTCVDVCQEDKWIKQRDGCVEKATRFHEMCYVHSCNVTVTLDNFKDVAIKFFADMAGVQLAESDDEDDEEGSAMECAKDCDAHLQNTLRKCPCYQSDDEKLEEENVLQTMKDSILNLTTALEEITKQYSELKTTLTETIQKNEQTVKQYYTSLSGKIEKVEEKAHRCKNSYYNSYYDC